MKIPRVPNLNYAWSHLIIRELLRLGVQRFFVAPGSRSSPLAWTVAELAGDKLTVHFDERGLGFMALGHARATGRPAVVITTSGSAVANLLPAVCEAGMDEVPMILLTADRPPELRDTGANQAMDQIKLFGSYTRWFVDLPCPAVELAPRYVLNTIDQAFFKAMQVSSPGPVHVNQMFREPLAPLKNDEDAAAWLRQTGTWWNVEQPQTAHVSATAMRQDLPAPVVKILSLARRGVVVAGAARSAEESRAMLAVAEKLGWPLLPDIRSGLRLFPSHDAIISMADQLLLVDHGGVGEPPDVVLHLGGRLTSKRMQQFVYSASAGIIRISASAASADPERGTGLHVVGEIAAMVKSLPVTASPKRWLVAWKRRDQCVQVAWRDEVERGNALSEPLAAALIARHLPPGHSLVLASSMPVRDMDMYGLASGNMIPVISNRGVSGIDGTLATAVGFAIGTGRPVTLVIGDLAFLHDLNSLALVRNSPVPVRIVLINNDGGGIFSFLPVAAAPKHFQTCFGTPHGLTSFAHAAAQFGLTHTTARTKDEMIRHFADPALTVIEINTTRAENLREHQRIQDHLAGS